MLVRNQDRAMAVLYELKLQERFFLYYRTARLPRESFTQGCKATSLTVLLLKTYVSDSTHSFCAMKHLATG